MYRVVQQIHFIYGHRLLNYKGKCAQVHGHNGLVEIELRSNKLDSLGMVYDFDDIERTMKTWIYETLDHKMLLNKKDPLVEVFKGRGEPVYLFEDNPTAEVIAREIFIQAKTQGLPVFEVRVWETPGSLAAYNEEN
ncbi:MAG TPA: 6-carboxytetrahydropterin synthase [Candidatus Limnocylindrales bacterium]|nr:6-carboxytetrahydropterin synthase [Candidatus Limnocylindrales bacterium]